MRIAIIADVFPPMRSSGAVQLRDLSREMVKQGHEVTIMIPDPSISKRWSLEMLDGVEVLRLRSFRTRDTNYLRRTFAELAMPYAMRFNLKRSPLASRRFDGVVWYSPTIFLGPLVKWVKKKNQCRAYLIIRDIFPEWAVDMGLMRKGPAYHFFRKIAEYQYSIADVIGVQTPGNIAFFEQPTITARVEILHNWLSETTTQLCSIDISNTSLVGRRVAVYAGNMGVAQGMSQIMEVVKSLKSDNQIGFVFVGRGTDAELLKKEAIEKGLDNVLFFDEIDPDEIPGLYAQCDIGLVVLHPKHRTHNIPGKFISYMHSGLPTFAVVNKRNDIIELIEKNGVGWAYADEPTEVLAKRLRSSLQAVTQSDNIRLKCKNLALALFGSESAVKQVADGLEK